MSFHEMAVQETEGALCDAGIGVVADALGITPDTLVNVKGMMAGPTDGNRAIQHIDFGLITDTVMGNAFMACEQS